MQWLVGLCVRQRGAVAALSALALVLGVWGAIQAPLDVFPEFVPSQVDIQTEAPGFAPQQVEELVTKQIENAVNGAAGLATLRSESIPGLSVVSITFEDGIDLHVARQGISERLSELGGALPAGVAAPKLSPLVSSTMDLLKVGLVSDKVDAYTLRDAAEWTIKPRLLAVPGVAHAIVFGGDVREIQILPDPGKLIAYGITLNELADAARSALALRGAGFIDLQSQRILLKSPTPAPDVDAIGAALISVHGTTPIRLRDVAEIKEAPALRFGSALVMGKPGVLLSLASQWRQHPRPRAVEQALTNWSPRAGAGIDVYGTAPPGKFYQCTGRSRAVFADRGIADLRVYLFLRDSDRADRHRGHPHVLAGGRRCDHLGHAEYHDARRLRGCPRCTGRRRHHRHREHPAAHASQCAAGDATAAT